MASRFDRRAHRDPRVGLRAERTKLLNEDIVEASQVMHEAHAQARYLVESAQREAEELLEAARATGRAVIAEAERDAAALCEHAVSEQSEADDLVADARPPGKPIELNRATMQDLRGAGLSITQARRVIARRDANGYYESIEELADLPGMPGELVERIKPHLRV